MKYDFPQPGMKTFFQHKVNLKGKFRARFAE